MTALKSNTIRVLGLDPGKANFGFSVLECTLKAGKILPPKVLECGVLTNPIRTLAEHEEGITLFVGEIGDIIDKHKVQYLYGERFQNRGFGASMGDTIEIVNFMLGILCFLYPTTLILAATWKNRVKRRGIDLKALYKDRSKYLGEPHELDGTLQALYGAQVKFGILPTYDFKFKPIIQQIHEKSICPETVKRLTKVAKQVQEKTPTAQVSPVRSRKPLAKKSVMVGAK